MHLMRVLLRARLRALLRLRHLHMGQRLCLELLQALLHGEGLVRLLQRWVLLLRLLPPLLLGWRRRLKELKINLQLMLLGELG